ncbi:hypothetical protein SNEBB_000735 [Seison nebaliae]|nr:hypothetical protein SNEBB_000735 [Seison nebaliae]
MANVKTRRCKFPLNESHVAFSYQTAQPISDTFHHMNFRDEKHSSVLLQQRTLIEHSPVLQQILADTPNGDSLIKRMEAKDEHLSKQAFTTSHHSNKVREEINKNLPDYEKMKETTFTTTYQHDFMNPNDKIETCDEVMSKVFGSY